MNQSIVQSRVHVLYLTLIETSQENHTIDKVELSITHLIGTPIELD